MLIFFALLMLIESVDKGHCSQHTHKQSSPFSPRTLSISNNISSISITGMNTNKKKKKEGIKAQKCDSGVIATLAWNEIRLPLNTEPVTQRESDTKTKRERKVFLLALQNWIWRPNLNIRLSTRTQCQCRCSTISDWPHLTTLSFPSQTGWSRQSQQPRKWEGKSDAAMHS